MSAPMSKTVVYLLILLLVLSVVGVALVATLPRGPAGVTTVTQYIPTPTLSIVTVTAPGAPGATVTVTAPPTTVTQTVTASGAPGATVTQTVTQTVMQTVMQTVTIGGTATPTPKKISIFFFDPAPANPWWDILAKGVEEAVNELKLLGVNVDYRRFDSTSLDQQISQIQQAISLRPDIAIVGPVSDAVQDVTKQLRQAGAKVIMVDRDFPDQTARDLYLGTDNRWAARVEAEAFLSWLGAKGVPKPWKIIIFRGLPGIPTSYLRYEGFMDALKPYIDRGDAQVLEEVQVDPDQLPECYAKASAIVPKYGKTVTAYFATNLLQAMAIVRALLDNKITPGVDLYVLGFDAQVTEWVDMIAKGQVALSIQQHPHTMGYWAVWAGYYLVTGIMKLPEKAVINTPTYKVVPCNATYSLMLDWFKIPPTELLALAQQLSPSSPQLHAPGYYSYACS
jgi:ABC-type sugar transport system substrate-binding protein